MRALATAAAAPERERTCTRCGATKPIESFAPTIPGNPRHRRRACRACRVAASAAWDRRHPDRARERMRRYRRGGAESRATLARRRARRAAAGLAPAPRGWWSTARAACETGYAPSYLARLCKRGILRAARHWGGDWYIEPSGILARARAAGKLNDE